MQKESFIESTPAERESSPSIGDDFLQLIRELDESPGVSWNGKVVGGMAAAGEVWDLVGRKIRNPELSSEDLMRGIQNDVIREKTLAVLDRLFPKTEK